MSSSTDISSLEKRERESYVDQLRYLENLSQRQGYVLADMADHIAAQIHTKGHGYCNVCNDNLMKVQALFEQNIEIMKNRRLKLERSSN